MRTTIQAFSIIIALVLGILFGMDFAGEDSHSSNEMNHLTPKGNSQLIQLTPNEGKVEIEVIDSDKTPQIIKVEPKEVENEDINYHELKGSMLGEVTNTIGSSLRGQTRKLLEWIIP